MKKAFFINQKKKLKISFLPFFSIFFKILLKKEFLIKIIFKKNL